MSSSIGYTEPGTGKQIEIEISTDGAIRAPRNAYESKIITGFLGTPAADEIRSIGKQPAGTEAQARKAAVPRSSKRRSAPVVDPQLAETGSSEIAEPEKPAEG